MPSPEHEERSRREAERRRRAAELLGDAEASKDDSDEGWGDRPASTSDDDYLRDVPPHH